MSVRAAPPAAMLALVAALAATLPGCSRAPVPAAAAGVRSVPLKIGGGRRIVAELADTPALQEKGLMYRTDLGPDSAMLFWLYPAGGGAPQVANFWMKNTPTPLDIVFVRADGTIARIAENAVPFSEAMISSGEPVAAVLELVGGRAGELGLAPGGRIALPKR